MLKTKFRWKQRILILIQKKTTDYFWEFFLAFFVAFYFIILMSYISMNKGIQKKTSERFGYVAAWDFDYEVIGTAIG